MNLVKQKNDYHELGFVSPLNIISAQQAGAHRRSVEHAEQQIGAVHYLAKMHTILRSPWQLATHPIVLDMVEQILGPDILLYNTTYIIKEANTPAHVSWHQDLTYWGLDCDAQVSMWLALSVADEKNGCMRMIPGSHVGGRRAHDFCADDPHNVLFQNQTAREVNEADAVYCPLQPGQASFHHGWTLHSSLPNRSDGRRIGLNVQYIAPHVRQTKMSGVGALLVRGEDRFHYYEQETPASCDLEPAALALHQQKDQLHKRIAGSA